MSKKDNDIKGKLLEVFSFESQEHLLVISRSLLELEQSRPDERSMLFEQLFRAVHNFKGAAAAVNQDAVEAICQSFETLVSAWKDGSLPLEKQQLDTLSEVVDTLHTLLERQVSSLQDALVARALGQMAVALDGRSSSQKTPDEVKSAHQAEKTLAEMKEAKEASPLQAPDPLLGTARLSVERLDLLLREAEEMLSVNSIIADSVGELRELSVQLNSWRKELAELNPYASSARYTGNGGDVINYAEWVDWNESQVISIQEAVNSMLAALQEKSVSLSTMTRNHLQNMKEAALLPFANLTGSLHRTARDLLRKQDKRALVEFAGEELEIDRRILQELKVPLLHLLRNAIDHGLESPEARRRAGKDAEGNIRIELRRLDNSRFRITVADDGSGIDVAKVIEAAAAKGALREEEKGELPRREALHLIFRSGVSTSARVSTVSGRGVGMAVVRETIERLSGQVWVETREGEGTAFFLELPTTISTLRVLQIRLDKRPFMLPTAFVVQALQVDMDMVQTIENTETISLAGETIALVDLGAVLGLSRRHTPTEGRKHALVLQSSGKRIAVVVDQIHSEREVLMKGLGPQLEGLRMIAGGAILGNGDVVPVLNITDLVGRSRLRMPGSAESSEKEGVGRARELQTVLVAEDSITSRTLLKNILESAGFAVKTAKDGLEALSLLKNQTFDVVVSDVDMPRMNGFELTRNIRDSAATADLPVILVTALESRSDRELGIEAGASAYIVKSKFDNMDLLQTIRRLI